MVSPCLRGLLCQALLSIYPRLACACGLVNGYVARDDGKRLTQNPGPAFVHVPRQICGGV